MCPLFLEGTVPIFGRPEAYRDAEEYAPGGGVVYRCNW